MAFSPFEVTVPHLAYTILGAFVVVFSMFSLVIKEKAYIGEAPIATIIGIIFGPYVSGFFNPRGWADSETADEITLEVTRVIIAVSVFAVGVELPKAYMKKHWRTIVFLLGPCMLWGWMITALLMWAFFPHLEFLSCLVIAAAVTPTDPILAQAVIGGKFADKHVPAHVRHMLSAESGCNDGAAFPFLGIALYLTLDRSPGHAVGEWVYATILYEVALGIVLGSLVGWIARKVLKFSESRKLIDRQSFVAQYISLAVFTIGFTTLLGSDDLLSAFACGTAFAWDGFFNKATEDAEFSNVIDLLFNCAAFIYIGAIIPFSDFNNHELHIDWWRLVVFAILVLLLRRIPVILALYKWIPDIKTFREAIFSGWFGPMGVGAIFIATLAKTRMPEGAAERDTEQVDLLRECILPIVSFLVLSSIVTHGLSIPFFSLSRRVHSITHTWSRNPSMDTRRDNEPAWTTHARRIVPGQDIVVNRDDEEGDLGVRQKTQRSDDSDLTTAAASPTSAPQEFEMEQRSQTPPLAEYREGHHLIIERRASDTAEIEVEVVRNHFADHKETERETFRHPRRLQQGDIHRLREGLPKSLEHGTSQVRDNGADAVDDLGLGLMHSHTSSEASAQPEERPTRSLRQRIFGTKQAEHRDEEASQESSAPDAATPDAIQRSTSIRFAPDSLDSSDSAPGNYGNGAPGFKRNPALAMFRSTSVQSEGPSVTFQEPTKPR